MLVLVIEFILFIIIGSVSGFLSGMLGIGGGVIVVPGLALVFKHFAPNIPASSVMHMAAGTSLAAMVITASGSTYTHQKLDDIDWKVWLKFLPGGVVGAIVGAWIASLLPTHVLAIIFGVVLLFIAVHIYWDSRKRDSDDEQLSIRVVPYIVYTLGGAAFGVFSGLLGVGGGVLIIPFMLYLHYHMHDVVGTSAAVILPLSIVGGIAFIITGIINHVAVHYASGYVYWPAFAGVAIGSVLFVALGARTSHRVDVSLLKKIFSVLLVFIAIELFAG
ncbi:MAG: sulfite exporter TauE/SafE family protein [Coxiellaceae bacterium]|nr:sulfite exporter TauE/SafE family protein [Coxiellaceae bacterium]